MEDAVTPFDDHVVTLTVWRRASRYAHEGFGRQFLRQVMTPPTYVAEGPSGAPLLLRRTGSGVYYPFWRGYDGVGRPLPAATAGGVAYMAGRFRRLVPGQAVPVGGSVPEPTGEVPGP
jgi:hypothetical protein